jgi:amino acid transporter
LFLSAALSLGVKESSLVNNVFTIVNIAVVLFVILAGSFKGKVASESGAMHLEIAFTGNYVLARNVARHTFNLQVTCMFYYDVLVCAMIT